MRSAHVRLTAADAPLSPGRWARAARVVRATLRSARRALLTMRPTWAPLLAAVVVVTPTAAAVATWATLPSTGPGLHLPATARVEAASVEPEATAPGADPRLQDGYTIEPRDVQPSAPGLYAAPGGPPDIGPPPFLTSGLMPHWPDIDRAAREHGLDPWAWSAVIVTECPRGVDSVDPQTGLVAPSCTYNHGPYRVGGLAQITDDTAAVIAGQSGYPCVVDKLDPMTSLRCGAYHYRDLLAAAGSVWRAEDELPALQVAAIAYNAGGGSSAYRGALASAQAGGDACAGIPAGFDGQTHRYCAMMRDMWAEALAARGAGPSGPAGLPHLEAMR